MSMAPMRISMSESEGVESQAVDSQAVESLAGNRNVEALAWPLLPTETEIYLLPDGRVVIADMPIELLDLVTELNGGVVDHE